MPHQRSFRLGWQSQNLARFILYEFSFLAEPVQVADDIGVDFFCTLFEVRREKTSDTLLPRNSFAIQIKSRSNEQQIDLTGYLPYLQNMQLPFFIGIIDRKSQTLAFYSGELLTPLFAYKGPVKHLKADLCERSTIGNGYSNWLSELSPDEYLLRFPKITEISANMDDRELALCVNEIREICSIMLDNIASAINNEFILKGASEERVLAFAGPGSFQVFEMNFFKRLSEAFFNLAWGYSTEAFKSQSVERFRLFKDVYQLLKDHFGESELPSLLREMYEKAKRIIEPSSQ